MNVIEWRPKEAPKEQIERGAPLRSIKSRTAWRRDVRLAVDIFGRDEVKRALCCSEEALISWLRGDTVPADGSTLPQRLATLLKE